MGKQDIPLIVYLVCIVVIVYLFITDSAPIEDDDSVYAIESRLDSWANGMSEAEEPEYGVSC